MLEPRFSTPSVAARVARSQRARLAAGVIAALVWTGSAAIGPASVSAATETVTTVSASTNPALSWDSVTFTATVVPSPGGGEIHWLVNGANVATTTIDAAGVSVMVRKFQVGTYQISAVFLENVDFGGSVGRLSETVERPTMAVSSVVPVPDYEYSGACAAKVAVGFTPVAQPPFTIQSASIENFNGSTVLIDGLAADHYRFVPTPAPTSPYWTPPYFANVYLSNLTVGTHTIWIKGGLGGVYWSAWNGASTVVTAYLATDFAATFSVTSCVANLPDLAPPAVTPPRVRLVGSTSMGARAVPVRVSWAASDTGGVSAQQVVRQIDGGPWTALEVSGATTRALSTKMRFGHSYSFAVRAQDGAGNWSAWAIAPASRLAGYSESSTAIARRGTWKPHSATAAWGGHYRTASVAGASVSLTFSGRGFAFVTRRSLAHGRVRVYLDGAYKTTISLYGSSLWRRVAYAAGWSVLGTHTVKLVVVGTAGHPRIDLDGIVVLK